MSQTQLCMRTGVVLESRSSKTKSPSDSSPTSCTPDGPVVNLQAPTCLTTMNGLGGNPNDGFGHFAYQLGNLSGKPLHRQTVFNYVTLLNVAPVKSSLFSHGIPISIRFGCSVASHAPSSFIMTQASCAVGCRQHNLSSEKL